MKNKPISDNLVGVVWPENQPGCDNDPFLYGQAEIQPNNPVEARSFQTFQVVYTAGKYGLDDTGSIRVVFRFANDAGKLQMSEAFAPNYVSASTNAAGRIDLSYHDVGHQRPWFKCLTARLNGGYLKEGDTITIIFGDTSQGSPGMQMQSFCDSDFEFRVLADVCAVGHYLPLSPQPAVAIVPGIPVIWKAVLPSLRRPGERFQLGIKAEDAWGNPSDKAEKTIIIESNLPVDGLPGKICYPMGEKAITIENLSVQESGTLRIALTSNGKCLATAGPLVIEDGSFSGYWGDLHGQSAESLGTGTAREYFDFARNKAFLDITAHQANDFQVTIPFWEQLNRLTVEFQEDGRFVTLPGYEWSGNTCLGGDRNVFFKHEGRQIHRSSHALLKDRSDLHTDALDARQLFDSLKNEDCIVFAHVGGRYADIRFAHDPVIETAMEIHSAWGTFEWLLTDGFELGHRSGVVCNSDGHKGRPGASYPGTSKFGAYGGLTCFLTNELTRDSVFECLRRRHHYGTTGCRMHLDVRVRFLMEARLFERDPNVFPDTVSRKIHEVMMGDIVKTSSDSCNLTVGIAAHAPIERVEIRNGSEVVDTIRPYHENELGSRFRIIWRGAEYRGRGRETYWIGKARFKGSVIKRIKRINHWNPERILRQCDYDTVEWNTLTTGNFGGFDIWLDRADRSVLELQCNHGSLRQPLREIGLDDIKLEAGGLNRQIRISRLPEQSTACELEQTLSIPLKPVGDNPLWVCVTTDDGFQAWSSPVFVFRS